MKLPQSLTTDSYRLVPGVSLGNGVDVGAGVEVIVLEPPFALQDPAPMPPIMLNAREDEPWKLEAGVS